LTLMFLWPIITATSILKVLKHSKGKNLRQRAKIIWIGTKLFFLVPTIVFSSMAIISVLITIIEHTNLDSATFDIVGLCSLITLLLIVMIVWETWEKWEKEIEAV